MPEFSEVHTTQATPGWTIVKGAEKTETFATYDVDLDEKANVVRQWLKALDKTLDLLVSDAEKPQRDSSILAIQAAAGHINEALRDFVEAAYEREVTV